MARRFGGVGVVIVSAATAGCGLLLLSGVGPWAGGAPLQGDVIAPVESSSSEPEAHTPTTTTTPGDTTTTVTTPVEPTTTTITAPVDISTTVPERPAPVPLAVSTSQRFVGAGGVVTFNGRCPTFGGTPLGPVVLWIVGRSSEVVSTNVVAETWSYAWTAPADESEFASFTFQFWCGDPTGYEGDYPADLLMTVDMVAVAPPVTTTTAPLVESEPPVAIIPETD